MLFVIPHICTIIEMRRCDLQSFTPTIHTISLISSIEFVSLHPCYSNHQLWIRNRRTTLYPIDCERLNSLRIEIVAKFDLETNETLSTKIKQWLINSIYMPWCPHLDFRGCLRILLEFNSIDDETINSFFTNVHPFQPQKIQRQIINFSIKRILNSLCINPFPNRTRIHSKWKWNWKSMDLFDRSIKLIALHSRWSKKRKDKSSTQNFSRTNTYVYVHNTHKPPRGSSFSILA